ncbi:HTTM domain-containing protein [Natronobeatus ordinarius]|uniref:HTTM domain-containing protein n=1 Tax=Natronobeatus ordinarius TaxID=2963433 RepID=UPI0020CE271D|nr:HTTM domain-containing protein [Natronobeatus ordinarius]
MNRRVRSSLVRLVVRLREYLLGCFRVDTRSLAVFRIFLGALVVADVFLRARNFSFYYTDGGLVPQELAREYTAEYAVSVYYLTSDSTLIAALMGLQVLFALALIVGYRTRAMTVVSFLFVVSLDHHNPFVLSYADTLFRLLFFWAIFLPLGERWSVDAVHRDRSPRRSVVGVATALALGQMVFMYVLNGVHKSESALWKSGEAAPLVFGIDEMTFLLGDVLREFPTLLTYGGMLWFYMLLGAWLLIFLRGRLRVPLLVLFVGGHLSFALTVRIGAFAYVAIAGLALFIPTAFWRDGRRVCQRFDVDPDGVVPRDRLRGFARPLPAVQFVPDRYAAVKAGVANAALALVVAGLAVTVAVFVLNAGAVVADGGYDQHRLNHEVAEAPGGEYVHVAADSLGIVQPEWSVFAPHPRTTDRYYVFGARTTDGERLDVFNDRAFTWERPGNELQTQHDTYRERFFMNSIRRSGSNDELPANLGEHICTTYEDDGVALSHISMFEVTERITMETINEPDERERETEHFYRHTCDT